MLLVLSVTNAQTTIDWGSCIEVDQIKKGDNCNDPSSVSMRFKNKCTESIDMCYCLEKSDGTWTCALWSDTKPGDSSSFFTCKGTGKYIVWSRKTGDTSVTFPTEKELNTKPELRQK